LATFVAAPVSLEPDRQAAQQQRRSRDRLFALALTAALTLFAVTVHGYHPYAEDGGLYMAGIKHLLDPNLYPHQTQFVTEHLRFSLFAPLVATLARGVGLLFGVEAMRALPPTLLALHLITIWLTLFAAWLLAARCYPNRLARAGAVTLLACWLGLPVAGTSLLMADPYLTARSFSTPCMILLLVGVLDLTADWRPAGSTRAWARILLSAIAAFLVHPLMGAYALAGAAMLACLRSDARAVRLWGTVALGLAAFAFAGCLEAVAPAESPAYIHVALTRSYWFLATWRWYELLGLLAPIAILAAIGIRSGHARPSSARALALTGVAAGIVAAAIALCFAHQSATTHLVARLQPLRLFQVVYLVMVLSLGALLAEHLLQRRAVRWLAALAVLGGIMVAAERATYPASAHFETTGVASRATPGNPWVQAFLWIRTNTPKDALFALDPDYISQPGEDAQGFRALAERSALPDYSKDGGEASIAPALTGAWTLGQQAQAGLSLSATTDAERRRTLQPLGVDWVILSGASITSLPCPYRSAGLQVCRLQ
jgi:hypothetical protein